MMMCKRESGSGGNNKGVLRKIGAFNKTHLIDTVYDIGQARQ